MNFLYICSPFISWIWMISTVTDVFSSQQRLPLPTHFVHDVSIISISHEIKFVLFLSTSGFLLLVYSQCSHSYIPWHFNLPPAIIVHLSHSTESCFPLSHITDSQTLWSHYRPCSMIFITGFAVMKDKVKLMWHACDMPLRSNGLIWMVKSKIQICNSRLPSVDYSKHDPLTKPWRGIYISLIRGLKMWRNIPYNVQIARSQLGYSGLHGPTTFEHNFQPDSTFWTIFLKLPVSMRPDPE